MEQQIDKSARSCFVGNIPYEATEEKLKEIFSSVGPIVSLSLCTTEKMENREVTDFVNLWTPKQP